MALLKKDPEKERLKQEQAQRKAQEDAERAFWAAPQGRARLARNAEAKWFQIALPLSATQRTAVGVLSGDHAGMKKSETQHHEVIGQIEDEGWSLWHVGYVWQQTGSVSRDKLMSSGQVESVTGEPWASICSARRRRQRLRTPRLQRPVSEEISTGSQHRR
jgi:hypothetical protein